MVRWIGKQTTTATTKQIAKHNQASTTIKRANEKHLHRTLNCILKMVSITHRGVFSSIAKLCVCVCWKLKYILSLPFFRVPLNIWMSPQCMISMLNHTKILDAMFHWVSIPLNTMLNCKLYTKERDIAVLVRCVRCVLLSCCVCVCVCVVSITSVYLLCVRLHLLNFYNKAKYY